MILILYSKKQAPREIKYYFQDAHADEDFLQILLVQACLPEKYCRQPLARYNYSLASLYASTGTYRHV